MQPGYSAISDPVTGTVAMTAESRGEIWTAGFTRTLEKIGANGTPIAVIATIPQLHPYNVDTCPLLQLWITPQDCAQTRSRAFEANYRKVSLAANRRAVARVPSASLVDFTDKLCSPTQCASQRRGLWLYKDESHLSVVGAATLGPAIDHRIMPLAKPLRAR